MNLLGEILYHRFPFEWVPCHLSSLNTCRASQRLMSPKYKPRIQTMIMTMVILMSTITTMLLTPPSWQMLVITTSDSIKHFISEINWSAYLIKLSKHNVSTTQQYSNKQSVVATTFSSHRKPCNAVNYSQLLAPWISVLSLVAERFKGSTVQRSVKCVGNRPDVRLWEHWTIITMILCYVPAFVLNGRHHTTSQNCAVKVYYAH